MVRGPPSYDRAVSLWIPLISTIVGGGLTIAGGSLLEWRRNRRQDDAAWRAMQVGTIVDLQEQLTAVKTLLGKGNISETAKLIPDLATLPERNRAMMMCSRLDDKVLRDEIWQSLVNAKEHLRKWQSGDNETWLHLMNTFEGFQTRLGALLLSYHHP